MMELKILSFIALTIATIDASPIPHGYELGPQEYDDNEVVPTVNTRVRKESYVITRSTENTLIINYPDLYCLISHCWPHSQ